MIAETSDPAARIDLAHVADFAIGALEVRPATREVMRDGQTDILEPRVMQVLVALARAGGGVVSRDDLTQSCWEGRVVGEDAINRVISRLRRVGETIGQNCFRVETVTKVGYRLVTAGGPTKLVEVADPRAMSRRRVIGGGVALAAAIAGAGWWLWPRSAAPSVPPEVAALIQQATSQMRQANAEGNAQAIGLFRRAVEVSPDYADGWGYLALSYAAAAHGRSPDHVAEMIARARSAAQHALSVDPDNPLAQVALVNVNPMIGNWLVIERTIRAGLARHPGAEPLLMSLAGVMGSTGRNGEAVRALQQVVANAPPAPGPLYLYAQQLWAANRLEEAQRVIDQAFELFPIHFAVWFTRCYFLMYNSRGGEAIAMIEDRGARPPGIPDTNFANLLLCAKAMRSGAEADTAAALSAALADAHAASGAAENALQFASVAGRVDDAFAIADAYYFGRGFNVGEVRFSTQQGSYTRTNDRRTFMLFLPSTAKMRSDPRFAALVDEIGLSAYWKASGTKPDYRR